MTWRIITADCIEAMAAMEASCVQCVVTSPPYWGLRDYGVSGQLGLESTPEEYVERLVAVFREVRRVLRDDGTVWLNLGDSYAGSWGNQGRKPDRGSQRPINGPMIQQFGASHAIDCDLDGDCSCQGISKYPDKGSQTGAVPPGLKPKDLVGIPWRVAFALQADGWWLRSDIIWAKPNPMPESVVDRPTKAHEYVFLLSKSARYFYDAEAVREPHASRPSDLRKMREGLDRIGGLVKRSEDRRARASSFTNLGRKRSVGDPEAGRNLRSVWNIATEPFPGAHFATFPKALVEPCVKAGSRPGDVVLDPFAGSGTTGVVALRLGRSFVGIELNPEYAEMGRRRIQDDAPLLNISKESPGSEARAEV